MCSSLRPSSTSIEAAREVCGETKELEQREESRESIERIAFTRGSFSRPLLGKSKARLPMHGRRAGAGRPSLPRIDVFLGVIKKNK